MKSKHLLIILFILTACSAKKKIVYHYGSFTDERDGHVYKTIKIGNQTWMAENLAYIFKPGPKGAESNYYQFGVDLNKICGRLYNFDALLQGAAPKGWHVPSDKEWREMEDASPDPITALKILYGGEYGTGKFSYFGEKAAFYTSTQDGYPIITRYINKGDHTIYTNKQGIGWQLSVRCVKDADPE